MRDYEALKEAAALAGLAYVKLLEGFAAATIREVTECTAENAAEAAKGKVSGDAQTLASFAQEALSLHRALEQEAAEWASPKFRLPYAVAPLENKNANRNW